MSETGSVRVGSVAPDFTLPDSAGNPVNLYSLLEKGPVVLYFYPKDETTGCTAQACEFRDRYEDFTAAGATVLGVSDDSVESHRSFREHHRLPFVLLADERGRLRTVYGVKKTLGLLPGRVTYVIDQQRKVRHVFDSQIRVKHHVAEALRTLETLVPPR